MVRRPSLRPGIRTRREEQRHPSWQRGDPYSQDLCLLVAGMLHIAFHHNHPQTRCLIAKLRLNNLLPSTSTQQRWIDQQNSVGHVLPYRRTGNVHATRLRGRDLLLLAIYRVIHP